MNIISDGFELKGSQICIYDLIGQIIYKGRAENTTHEVISYGCRGGILCCSDTTIRCKDFRESLPQVKC